MCKWLVSIFKRKSSRKGGWRLDSNFKKFDDQNGDRNDSKSLSVRVLRLLGLDKSSFGKYIIRNRKTLRGLFLLLLLIVISVSLLMMFESWKRRENGDKISDIVKDNSVEVQRKENQKLSKNKANQKENKLIEVFEAQVLNIYPHDPKAFTQGLEIFNDELFETTGLVGRSSLRSVDLESGKILRSVDIPSPHFGEGLTILNNLIYVLTWRTKVCFVYDLNFNLIKEIPLPHPIKEGWGLTNDGKVLLLSDGSDKIYFVEPENFTVLKKLNIKLARQDGQPRVSLKFLNELEYIELNGKSFLFANVWFEESIVLINLSSSNVDYIIDCRNILAGRSPFKSNRDAVLNGIAFNKNRPSELLITGKLWDSLLRIQMPQVFNEN